MGWLWYRTTVQLAKAAAALRLCCFEAVRQTIDVTPWANARFRLSLRIVLNRVLLMIDHGILRESAPAGLVALGFAIVILLPAAV